MAPKAKDEKTDAPAAAGSSDSNLMAAIGYIIGIFAVILYFIKKDDKFVRFHALQSVAFNIAVFVVFIVFSILTAVISVVSGGIGGILGLCMFPIMLVVVLYALYMAYMAFQGKMYKIPTLGDMVEKYV